MRVRTKRLIGIGCASVLLGALLAGCDGGAGEIWGSPSGKAAAPWRRTADSVVVHPSSGAAKAVRLQVIDSKIVRVTASATGDLDLPASLMVVATPSASTTFSVTGDATKVELKTAETTVDVLLANGAVSFADAQGKPLVTQYGVNALESETIEGKPFYKVRAEFNRGTDEGFYGLGQHQNRQMNYNGEDVVLAQHNMDVAVPFVVSTRNYGVLWDNNGITRFGDARDYQPLPSDLTITDANGKKGGLTARYYDGATLKLERVEADPDYQFIPDQVNWPAEMKDVKNRRVVWDGKIESGKPGFHKFRFYVSGYFKLSIDGKVVVDGWRQNWQGWFRNFDLAMEPGAPHAIHIEWTPQDGYLRLLHLDPLPNDERHELSFSSDVANAIDYYLVAGKDTDDVIGGYRRLTGKAQLMPLWSYGFWQSRQRYETQEQLLGVLAKYRALKIPLDNVVQDWFYWPEDAWGSHDFDAKRYPDPKAMVAKVHAEHAHIMLSVWPKFYPSTANYKELDALGHMYHGNILAGNKDWVGPGYPSSNYDPYSPEARDVYWRQIRDKLEPMGWDAIWLDNDEPDIHSNLSIAGRVALMGPTALGPAAEFFNSFPLMHVGGVYDHWRKDNPDQRLFLFSRSGYGGLQRYQAAVWSGDTTGTWSDMRDQISAGVNFSMSGIPNWSFDIGGYTVEPRYQKPNAADLAQWRELYTRWFEFGAFVPIFRAHGEIIRREIFELASPGTAMYRTLVNVDRTRYRLMPYIYSAAAATYTQDGTMMRGLVMDFPGDRKVWNIDDEYLFGRAFLVAPVTEYKARSRKVYLPAGTAWRDFYTGKSHEGGQEITAEAPLERMPLFVRAGSIVPTGPDVQYTNEKPGAPITLFIYTGADGHFSFYEDDGVSNGYTRGAFAQIPLDYDEATKTLTIGARAGSFPGMATKRTFDVRWIDHETKNAASFTAKADKTIAYSGSTVEVQRK